MMGTNSINLQRYTSRGICVALLGVLAIFVFAASASAATIPAVPFVVSQNTAYTALPSGGALSGEDPAGGTIGVNSQGVVVVGNTYGKAIIEFAPPAFKATVISPDTNVQSGAIAIDSNNFLYIADQYNNSIVKIPANANGTYTITVDPEGKVSSLPACAGDTKTPDTAGECLISAPGTALGTFGVSSIIVNASGTVFFATDDFTNSGAGDVPYSIYECKTTCLYGSSPTAPTLIYQEPIEPAGSVAQFGQYYIGALALDAYGNLFFTDSAETNGSLASADSRLNELPVATKTVNPANTGFVATPIAILTFTNTPAASAPYFGNYDNAIESLATDSNGHLYISIIYSGIYGLIDNGSLNGSSTGTATVSSSSIYGIANQDQVKLLASDNSGNFYAIGNGSSGDTLYFISTGPVKFPGAETAGTPETISAVIADNTAACTPALTITSPDTAFTATVTAGKCSNGYGSATSSFNPVTLTYTPTAAGFIASTLTIDDTTSSVSSAPQIVSSSGAAITISQGTYGAALPSGGDWGNPSPDGHTGAINTLGVVVFGTSYGNQITQYTNVAGVTTLFDGTAANPGVAGANNGGGGVAIDSNNNLYISSEYGNIVYKFPANKDGSYGPWTATTSNPSPLNASGATPVACVGTSADATAGVCQINIGNGNFNFGIAGLAVDSKGDLFITSDNQAATTTGTYAPDTVWECPLSCLYGSSPTAPVAIYAEPTAGASNPQLVPGSIVVDSSGNVYFTDSSISATGTEYSLYSDVNKLAVSSSSSTGYATNPTLLTKLTPYCTTLAGCNYNDAITTVSVDSKGNVFFATPYDGLYELTNTSGTLSTIPWAVGGQAAKTIVPDGKGNFYFVNYNSGDTTGFLALGSVTVTPQAQPSTPSTVTNVWAIDNNADCYASQGNLTFAPSEGFTAVETAGDNCTTLPFGSGISFPVSVTFTPTASQSGTVTTTLTATNSGSGDTGTANVTGSAAVQQPVQLEGIGTSVAYGAAASYTLSVKGNSSGNAPTFAVDAKTGTPSIASITGDTLTISGVGTFGIDITVAGGTAGGVTYAPFSGEVTITVSQGTPTISFTPASTLLFGSSETLTATSTNTDAEDPVVFSLDKTSTTGAATLSGSTLTATGTGTIVVDANQASDTNWVAATQVQVSITVTLLGTVATPTFSPASGTTLYLSSNNTVTISDTTSGATIWYTTDGSNPLTSSTATKYTGAITLSTVGNVTLTAAATEAGYTSSTEATASYVISAIPPNFTLSSSATTATVTSGQAATVTITVTPVGAFTSAVTFSASNQPTNVSAVFNPTSVTPSGGPVTTTLTLSKSASASLDNRPNPFVPAGATLAIAVCFLGWKKRRALLLTLVLIAGAFGAMQLTGCNNSTSTTSVMQVIASGGGISQTTLISVTLK